MIGQSLFPEDLDFNFFDNMDDLIDFPGCDIDLGLGIGDSDSFPNIWTTQQDTWPATASDPLLSSNTNSDSSPELYLPFEDIVKVERPASFVEESLVEKKEDSFSTNSSSSHSQFRSSSPVSVLESSSSSSQTTNTITSLVLPGKHGRPRTKRPRPPVQDKDRANVCGADSRLIIRIPKQFLSDHSKMITKKKKKKVKVTSSSSSSGIDLETNGNNNNFDSYSSEQQHPVRKCMHCEVTKTPQWRLGPMGPKTLCNACGVRYKSGRLFPEYRPAASPTFTPALHSNSHKKVAEMRSKRCNDGSYTTTEENDLIPNNAYIGVD